MRWLVLMILLAPIAMAGIQEDGQMIAGEIKPYLTDTADTVIVRGLYASKMEKVVLAYLRTNYPEITDVRVISDSESIEGYGTVFLLGGPMQNMMTDALALKDPIKEIDTDVGVVSIFESDRTYILMSDHQGYDNLPKTGPHKSPLAKIMPVEFVPLAATSLSFFLLWIGKLLLNLMTKVLRFKIGSKVMERVKKSKEFKKNYKGVHLKGIRIKYRELMAIIIAAAVFAMAVSYNYLFKERIFDIVMMTVGVNLLIYLIRNGVRLVMDRIHGMHTEYHIWYWGALLTVISGWLGNTFALAGFILYEEQKKDKDGMVAFMVNIITFCVFLVFGVWNILAPNPAVQMAMILAISLTFLQMLPVKPFSGKTIYSWKRWLWWISFIPILFCYLIINLV